MSASGEEENGVVAVMEAVIDGLRVADKRLNDKCNLALRAVGDRVIPWLAGVANDESTGSGHRLRLLAAIDQIEVYRGTNGKVGALVLAALLAGLRVSNAELNRKVTNALPYLGSDIVNRLITETIVNRNKTGYCLRLLKAAEQTGQRPGVTAFLDLTILDLHKDPEVRKQAMKVFTSRPAYLSSKDRDGGGNARPVTRTSTVSEKR